MYILKCSGKTLSDSFNENLHYLLDCKAESIFILADIGKAKCR